MKEHFPNIVKEMDVKVQEAQRIPNNMVVMKPMPRHTIIKVPKVLKAAREQQLPTYRGLPIILSADFSKENLQARKDWQEIFKVMKSRERQPRSLYQQT